MQIANESLITSARQIGQLEGIRDMAGKEITPQLGLESFSCPHCGAFAHQTWLSIWGKHYAPGGKPKPSMTANALTGEVSIFRKITSARMKADLADVAFTNLFLSTCFSCKNVCAWFTDELIYPTTQVTVQPHEDMPEEIKADFLEAGSIVNLSPRGAAALLRLALQKLMKILGESGKNLNDDIASLVSKGLETQIQKALDLLRVIGNSAVHPGQIDLRDDKATALALFNLLNLVVDRRIAAAKKLDEMYQALPPRVLETIQKRDAQ
jgi:hypothetical protein